MARQLALSKIILFMLIFFSLYSLVLGAFNIGLGTAPYSIFNEGDNGLSILKDNLLAEGYDVKCIVSTLQVLKRLNKTGVLAIIGPTMSFSVEEAISVLEFLSRGGSLLIADDFYSGNSLLHYISPLLDYFVKQIAQNVSLISLQFNTSGVLMDAANNYGIPARPIITSFNDPFGILGDVKKVVTNFPSTITLTVKIFYPNGSSINVTAPVPPEFSLMYTSSASWIETDLESAIKGNALPEPHEWGGVPFPVAIVFRIPTGGGIAIISDPDIFSNALVRLENFDNLKFAMRLFEWLARQSNSSLILFDESHLPHLPIDPIFGLSIWFKAIGNLVFSWIIAPFLPFLVVLTISSVFFAFIPKLATLRVRLFSRVERSPETTWYRLRLRDYLTTRNFRRAATVLLDYLSYLLSTRYSAQGETVMEMVEDLVARRSDLEPYKEEILSFVTKLYEIAYEGRRVSQLEFMELVSEFKKIRDLLEY